MKIRNGFVSNSSSSSFVCILKKDAADEIRSRMSELQIAIFDYVFGEPMKIIGVDVYETNGANGDAYYFFSDFSCPENLREEFEEKYQSSESKLWYSIMSLIDRLPEESRYSCRPDAG